MRKPLVLLALCSLALGAPALAQDPPAPTMLTHRAPEAIAADPANRLTLVLSNGGTVVIQLRPDAAPQNVYRIQTLASQGFYNDVVFHRVIPGFMAQTGDPTGTGAGGSQLPDVPAEFNRLPHVRGAVAMARAEDENSANSQFYIMFNPRFGIDHDYTVMGRVISGMDAVDNIAPGEPPAEPTQVVRAFIGGPLPAPPVIAQPEAEQPAVDQPASEEAPATPSE